MKKNSELTYGSIAKWLHWSIAIFFLLSYATVYFRHWFTDPKTTSNWVALHLHLSVGMSIGILTLLRIYWRWLNIKPKHPPGSRLEHLGATVGHWALYFFMITMPLTGYLGTHDNTHFFLIFEVPQFAYTPIYPVVVEQWLGLTFQEFEKPIDFFHKVIGGQYLVWMLILVHVVAALYHHLIKKDNTLIRMLPAK